MEDFIKTIYEKANIIESLKEFIAQTESGRIRDARNSYNLAAKSLEKLVSELSTIDPSEANKIQNIAIRIKNNFEDPCLSKGLVAGMLIPTLYQHMSNYTGIEVNVDRYLLKSSDTGYLTIRDNEMGRYLHDIHDPMWESHEFVRSSIIPKTNTYLLLGSGLGYTAYQLWHQTEGAVSIQLYEHDAQILKYAYDYGVLSLIPKENISIVHCNDSELLAERFLNDYKSMSNTKLIITSPWTKHIQFGKFSSEMNRIITNHELELEMSTRSAVNLFKNSQVTRTSIQTVKEKFDYAEWIVISAGPSFDDSVQFLKNSKGHRGLIAVNTVFRRLIKEGIIPDIVVAADQYIQMVEHIKGVEDHTYGITLIADWLLNWKYVSLYKGPICFVRTNSDPESTQKIAGNDPVWDVSGSVACLGIETAIRMNAKRIYLVGQDLAYPSKQKYAKGMPHSESPEAKWEMQVPSVDGGIVDTCEAFDWFRKFIEYQIDNNKNVEFINMSSHGAYIKGASSFETTK